MDTVSPPVLHLPALTRWIATSPSPTEYMYDFSTREYGWNVISKSICVGWWGSTGMTKNCVGSIVKRIGG